MGKNAINKQFEMNQGAHSDNNTPTGFRNPEGVAQAGGTTLNMGEPINYGTMAPTNMGHSPANMGHSPVNFGHPGGKKKKLDTEDMTYEEKLAYYKKQKEQSKNKKTSSIKMGIGSGRTSGRNIIGG